MPVAFYMDVHVPQPITDQRRRRGVDVLTAIEDGYAERHDHELLDRARELDRVIDKPAGCPTWPRRPPDARGGERRQDARCQKRHH